MTKQQFRSIPHYIILNVTLDHGTLTFSTQLPDYSPLQTQTVTQLVNRHTAEKFIESQANTLGTQYHQPVLIRRLTA